MESSRSCKSCGERSIVADDISGNMVCMSCCVVQDFDNYEAQLGGISGPSGTNVRVGTSGTGSVYTYKETKIYEAKKVVEDIVYRLGLSGSKSNDVKSMVDKITEGEFGQGKWFPVFVGGCAYVVMRRDNKTLPIGEVADVIGCDIYELGRMVSRILEFLELKLPEFDIVNSLVRAVNTCPSFMGLAEDVIGRILKQGVFIVQCLVKWFLTTGRRPMPVVAAVLVFVAAINDVDVKIDDFGQELHVAVSTCKKRYKELLEKLVEVAQVLPWGKDVTVKNILKNAHHVIQYMELKSMTKPKGERKNFDSREFDLENLVDHCLTKETRYDYGCDGVENDTQYFEPVNSQNLGTEEPGQLHISHECLTMIYAKCVEEASVVKSTLAIGENNRRKRGRGLDILSCTDWWKGKSQLSQKVLLKQILETDVGLDPMPPSFDRGCLEYERRREKINAAKLRIQRTMSSSDHDSGMSDLSPSKAESGRKKKRKLQVEISWEDLIIETLLLHQVKEEEIETGHYNALLALHVFNDPDLS